jgi:hypothetical protein
MPNILSEVAATSVVRSLLVRNFSEYGVHWYLNGISWNFLVSGSVDVLFVEIVV